MKIKLIQIAIAVALALSTISCGKDGGAGPQGAKGETGAQGLTGKDGTNVLSGTINPETTIGKEGDFYINLTTKILFGPKQSTGWGNGVGLSGQAGKDGNTILNGKGAPLPSIGQIGDFYFDTENMTIYGAKVSSGWGTPISLKANSKDGVKILIKEGLKLAIKDSDIEHQSDNGLNNVTVSDIENKILVGDISEYFKNGAVLFQVKINDQMWSSTHTEYEKSDFVFYTGIERLVSYDGNYLIFKDNDSWMTNIAGTKTQSINVFKNEVSKNSISYKIILISPSSLEKLNKVYPRASKDSKFLSTYFKVIN